MSYPRQKSAYLRYLRARLRIILRPEFWAATFILGLVTLFAWEYFKNPKWLNANVNNKEITTKQKTETENVSEEDKKLIKENGAIAADIDNSSVLNKELNIPSLPTAQIVTPELNEQQSKDMLIPYLPIESNSSNTEPTNPKKLQLLPSTQANKQTESYINPFVTSAQKSLNAGSLNNIDPSSNETQESSNLSSTGLITNPSFDNTTLANRYQNQNRNGALPDINQQQEVINTPEVTNITSPSIQEQSFPTSGYNEQLPQLNNRQSRATNYSYPQQQNVINNQNPYNTYLTPIQSNSVPVNPIPVAQPLTAVTPTTYNLSPYSPPYNQAPTVNNPNPGFPSTINNSQLQPSQLNQSNLQNNNTGNNINNNNFYNR